MKGPPVLSDQPETCESNVESKTYHVLAPRRRVKFEAVAKLHIVRVDGRDLLVPFWSLLYIEPSIVYEGGAHSEA